MPDENKKSRWDYLGKEPSEYISPIQKEVKNEAAVKEDIKATMERMEETLQKFATNQQWTLIPPEQVTYELKYTSFTDARLFTKFDISSCGTNYLNFIFVIGAILVDIFLFPESIQRR